MNFHLVLSQFNTEKNYLLFPEDFLSISTLTFQTLSSQSQKKVFLFSDKIISSCSIDPQQNISCSILSVLEQYHGEKELNFSLSEEKWTYDFSIQIIKEIDIVSVSPKLLYANQLPVEITFVSSENIPKIFYSNLKANFKFYPLQINKTLSPTQILGNQISFSVSDIIMSNTSNTSYGEAYLLYGFQRISVNVYFLIKSSSRVTDQNLIQLNSSNLNISTTKVYPEGSGNITKPIFYPVDYVNTSSQTNFSFESTATTLSLPILSKAFPEYFYITQVKQNTLHFVLSGSNFVEDQNNYCILKILDHEYTSSYAILVNDSCALCRINVFFPQSLPLLGHLSFRSQQGVTSSISISLQNPLVTQKSPLHITEYKLSQNYSISWDNFWKYPFSNLFLLHI